MKEEIMDFSGFCSWTLTRFNTKTREKLEKFLYNFHSCISSQRVLYIPLSGKKDFIFPKKCCNCLSPTSNSYEVKDSRYIQRTTDKDIMEIYSIKVPFCENCENALNSYSLEYPKEIKNRITRRNILITLFFILGSISIIFSLILLSKGSENIITKIIGQKYNLLSICLFMLVIPFLLFYLAKIHGYKLQSFVKEFNGFKVPQEIISMATASFLDEDKGIVFNKEYVDLFCDQNDLNSTQTFNIMHLLGHTYDFIEEKVNEEKRPI